MFTDNYVLCQKNVFLNSTSGYYKNTAGGNRSIKTNTYLPIGVYMAQPRCSQMTGADSYYPGVYFGTGSTPPSRSDIELEAPITSGLSFTGSGNVLFYDEGDGVYSASTTFTIKNTTSAEIVIREIGCFATGSGLTESGSLLYMMERTVLDNPITIPSGITKLITYKITFNQSQ